MMRGLKLSAPTLHPPGRGERLEVEFNHHWPVLMNHVHIMGPPSKSSTKGFGELLGGGTHQGDGRVVHGAPFPYLNLCISFIWLFLTCILYNKVVSNNKKCFPVFYGQLWQIIKPEEWVVGTPDLEPVG